MLETTDIVVTGIRALAFIAVVQAAGCALYNGTFLARLERSANAQSAVTFAAALGAIVLVVVHHASEPARLTASLSGIWDSGLQLIMLQSDAGAARAFRIVGLATIAWSAVSKNQHRGILMLVGAVLALCSFTMMGHTAGHPQRWLLAALLVVHLLIAAFWYGALLVFILAAKREKPSVFGHLVQNFSVIAGWMVPSVPLAGLVMAVILLPDIGSLTTPYGVLLIAKVVGFTLLMVLAAWNRFRLVPALLRQDQEALVRFRRVAIVEWLVIGLVLAMTATMTGLFGPD